MIYFIFPICAYLAGSVSTAILVSRMLGHGDPRDVGSGNPGATNVLRHGGKLAAALTLLGDTIKGLLPIIITRWFTEDPIVLALVALAAFLGHLFPIYFGFRGGKGVATALGVFLGLSPTLFLVMLMVWLLMALIFRYSSLAALTAAAASIPTAIFLFDDRAYIIVIVTIVTLLFLRHRSNIEKLRQGTEGKISFSKRG
jgi:glycerol-3-phosphate acyltransferase PlsY